MIDWWGVAGNGLWILGLSLLLATFSYRSWARSEATRVPPPAEAGASAFYNLGLVLFALGMLATSDAWWERAGWGAVLLLILGPVGLGVIRGRTTDDRRPTTDDRRPTIGGTCWAGTLLGRDDR